MGSHTVKRLQVGEQAPYQHLGRCKCGASSGKCDTTQEVDDWEMKHEVEIQRVRAHLGSRNPGLASQRDYYRQMAAEDPDVGHRPVWTQLADELDHRLNDAGADDENQPTLI